MISFVLRASLNREGLYSEFCDGKIGACRIFTEALTNGVNDYDDDDVVRTALKDVVAIVSDRYLLTYSKNEDIFDVWEQMYS